ncbi:PQQ-binding-like beta-propeller repeat protein [Streptomyces triculaminicus]|uniref:WD40 repeat domain-containing protein n=1 Tax=Streptomyces triculaminicus TaxID=2816232 RepID=UPI0033C7027D
MKTLEQIVSRHDPKFDVANARLGLGRDGKIYLADSGQSPGDGRALRVAADGSTPRAGEVGYAVLAITANAAGVIATAEAHIHPRVAFWDAEFNLLGHVDEFTDNDAVGFAAPSAIEAGASGDFYAVDQYALRVLRLTRSGVVAAFDLGRLGVTTRFGTVGLRVAEDRSRLYTLWPGPSGVVWASEFDGRPLWSVPAGPAGTDRRGLFDLDGDGRLHVLSDAREVRIYDLDGRRTGSVTLALPDSRPVTELRLRDGKYFVKRSDPTTLFEVYDQRTGAPFRPPVPADVERLTVSYSDEVWEAGRPVPLTIRHERGRWRDEPRFRVWWRPLGVPEFTELRHSGGSVTPPVDARGLYHLRVSPDVGGRYSEYVVDGVVEVRVPGSKGSLSILGGLPMTTPDAQPLNRFSYGRGEPVHVTVIARAPDGVRLPASVRLKVLRDGEQVGEPRNVALTSGKGEFEFGATVTASWEPGRYVLDADATGLPGFTVAPHHLEIGPGLADEDEPDFHITQHGDIYALSYPADPRRPVIDQVITDLPRFADVPDTTAAHLARARKLGLNLFVDRLGGPDWPARFVPTPADPEMVARLTADRAAVAPQKAVFEDPTRRAVAGYGAHGMRQQAILIANDASLPLLGPAGNFEPRDLEKLTADLQSVTRLLLPYAGFRGWSWAANWWLAKLGAQAAQPGSEQDTYTAALEAAHTAGTWSPVFETVSDRAFALKPTAEARLRAALRQVSAAGISAMTAPYRAYWGPPQTILAGADEIDLHYQAEQIQPPQVTGHMVDFYRRPGKPVWGHPELWNDDGTGGMFLPTLMQQAMRGANGTGMTTDAGALHDAGHSTDERNGGPGTELGDPRCGGAGRTSVLRAAFDMITRLGPATAAAQNGNRVAIVVSTRMQRLETWDGKPIGPRYRWEGQVGTLYFGALFEAYNACLYAHRPASFVFTEEAGAEVLRRYDAVLVVGQRVGLDPPLDAALRSAGVPVFYDRSCREELLTGFTPLDVSFDKVALGESGGNDDAAYYRFRRYFLDDAAVLRQALSDVTPVAECDNPEVLLSEWTSGSVRYIWVVNNTMLDWEPGLAWRVSLLNTQRIPVTARLKVQVPLLHIVVDLLTGNPVTLLGGEFTADLRTVPARVYAVVPLLHGPLPTASADAFGPHVRDVAVSSDGRTALLNTFTWDHNLYGLDLATGRVDWRRRIGHFFAFAPTAWSGGFAAQGFDVSSAEGYHLYLLAGDGAVRRRFALFGLPKKATNWARAEWGHDTALNSFAVSPDGSWVAACGDLGLALWNGSGSERWAHEWWADRRTPLRLLAVDEATLVTFAQGTITGLSAADGSTLWSITVTDSGVFGNGTVSGDRRTVIVPSNADGGRLYVIRGGVLANTIPTPAEEVSVSDDGTFIAVTSRAQLKAYDADGGLLWTYTGDDLLRRPRVSPDARRVAVGSELGTLVVLDRDGTVLAAPDLRALPVPAWLPDGDLLAATWMGTVVRYDTDMRPRWQSLIAPTETDIRPALLAPDPTPVVRRTGWGNATHPPLDPTPNLIKDTHALISAELTDPRLVIDLTAQNPVETLYDGRPDAPAVPWLPWLVVNLVDSGWHGKFLLTVDTVRTQVELTGITFAEDPAHPESWLRDVRIQWWEAENEIWHDGPMLLSDEALHSHPIQPPLRAARFRFATTGGGSWPSGNIRLGELVLHGRTLGASHRDVLARRGRAVLFDERVEDLRASFQHGHNPMFGFQRGGAFSGGTCLRMSGPGQAHPAFMGATFGHSVPDWDFEITEHPEPGQYRYFQFAWKATGPETTGMSVRIGVAWPSPSVVVSVGDAAWLPDSVLVEQRVPGRPPAEWTTVRVDLWALTGGRLPQVTSMSLLSNGGGALFDQLVLGRTPEDLP